MNLSDLSSLLTADIQHFIKTHENHDISALALKKSPDPGWPYKDILAQIKSRQKACKKIPQWLDYAPILYPPSHVIEQASSAATALFKASWVKKNTATHNSFIDLTAGAGIDSWALSSVFKNGHCIDLDPVHSACLEHNFKTLGLDHVQAHHGNAASFIQTAQATDVIYIDPARRDSNKKGRIQLQDCAPDILSLLPDLKAKSEHIIIKTSPMLDITKACRDLGGVSNVICVEYNGQCKEVLYHIETAAAPSVTPLITAVSIDDQGTALQSHQFSPDRNKISAPLSPPLTYLYDPGPAFLKSGQFQSLATDFQVSKLHPDTHLYTSNDLNPDFPGRIFKITDIMGLSGKTMPFQKANVIARNIPLSPEAFKKRYKIKDGGELYVFVCLSRGEQAENKNIVILCERV